MKHIRLTLILALLSIAAAPAMAMDGLPFTTPPQPKQEDAAKTQPTSGCVVGGCSGQLCVEEGSGGISTCEWFEHYACYQTHGTCTRLENGQCGWAQSSSLQACLSEKGGPH